MSRPSVTIAVPAADHCATMFAYDLAHLTGYSIAHGVGVAVCVVKTAYLPSSRTRLARAALDRGASHILWLDSDMRFPKDALVRLLSHHVPIVAASYSMRRMPLAPVASDGFDQSTPHYVANDATGLESVGMVGMGCMLTTTELFRALPEPWFATPYDPERGDVIGEDVWFCQRVHEAGYDVLVDAALTNEVGHLGEWEFGNAQLNAFHEQTLAAETPMVEVVSR